MHTRYLVDFLFKEIFRVDDNRTCHKKNPENQIT